MLKKKIAEFSEHLDLLRITYTDSPGFFESRFEKMLLDLGISEGKMLTGDNAYKVFEEYASISSVLRSHTFERVTIGDDVNVDSIYAWCKTIFELNYLLKTTNGSLCRHDYEKIKILVICLGELFPRINNFQIRQTEHNRLAHTYELLVYHGANLATERIVELVHQPWKKAASASVNVPLKYRM